MLGHMFGKKDVRRVVASKVVVNNGIGEEVLKKMLLVIANLVMVVLSC